MKRNANSVLALLADLSVMSGGHAQETSLTVQLDQPGSAISPYLYGQFIEHLGRCIHDGIWAEKRRDRKFLLALTNSPWEATARGRGVGLWFHRPPTRA